MARSYPLLLWFSTGVSLLGSIQFGYHLGVLNTPLSYVASDLGFSEERTGGLVVSALLVGATLGSLGAGALADALGPKRATIINAVPLAVGSALGAAANGLAGILLGALAGLLVAARIVAGRAVAGLGAGAASVYVPRYLSEISPDAIRGALGTLNQVCINVGILAAYVIGWPYEAGPAAVTVLGREVAWWRLMLAAAALPAALQALLMAACPETPVWLLWSGLHLRATKSFRRLHGPHFDPDKHPRLAAAAAAAVAAGREDGRADGNGGTAAELLLPPEDAAAGRERCGVGALLTPRYRRIMILAAGLQLAQQASGINSVIYYSTQVFRKAGLASPVLGSIAVGAANTITTLVAAGLMDRAGRRPLLLASFTGMAACLAVLAAVLLVPAPEAVLGPACLAAVLGYVACFALGCGPIPWVYLSEILPEEIKGTAQALCTALNWGSNLVVGLSFPPMLRALSLGGSYLVFAEANVAAVAFVAARMVETKRRPLADIQALLLCGSS